MTASAAAGTHPHGTGPLPAVGWLAAVGLDDLVASAGLLTRTDRKYLIPRPSADALVAALTTRARALQIDGVRDFGYESVYYDTDDLRSYRLTALRRRRRFKVRQRRYTGSGDSFLEVKTRGPRKLTVKERMPAPGPVLAGPPVGGRDFVLGSLDRARVQAVRYGALRPALSTRYRRSTLWLPADGSRVTLDSDLEWALPGSATTARLDRLVVVETKTSGGPCAADDLLRAAGHRPVRLSKFGTGLAALRPDLPSTKWRPVLRRAVLPHLLLDERTLTCDA